MSYDLENKDREIAIEPIIDLTTCKRWRSFGNKHQGRFYAPKLKIGDNYYFVDFSFIWAEIGDYDDYGRECVKNVKLGYYLGYSTGEEIKAHIWIGEPGQKRASPEVYKLFLDEIKERIICGWDGETEMNVYLYPNQVELSEVK
jgi:hypothetical protein